MKNGIRVSYLQIFITGIISFVSADLAFGDPILSNIESKNLEYIAGSGSVQITNSIEISNVFYLTSASIRIIGGYNSSEDKLIYDKVRSIDGEWNKSTGTLNLTGFASLSRYENALRNILYENTNKDNPSVETRVIAFTVNDGSNSSNSLTRNIIVISSNQPPLLSGLETDDLTYCMNSEQVQLTSAIVVHDPDNSTLASATIRISTGYYSNEDILNFTNQNGISGSWSNTTGSLTLSGVASLASYQLALRSIQYQNNNAEKPSGTYHEISFTVNDGKATSNTLTRGIRHEFPSAVISGSALICAGSETNLSVAFTGTAPWSFTYRKDAESPKTVTNITSNPYTIKISAAGTYTLVEVNDNYCEGNVSGSAVIERLPAPEVQLSGLGPIYSKQSSEWIPLTGFPAGGDFSGPGVIPYGTEWFFIPSLPTVGVHNIVYKYRDSPTSCYGYDTVSVRILEKSAAVQIENDRTKFCISDPPFQVTGINLINNDFGTFSISGGMGLVDNHNNTATVYPSQLTINQYTITYTSFDGTSAPQNIEIGNAFKADFEWNTECYEEGQTITFTNTSSSPFGFLNEDSYQWFLYGSSDTASWSTRNFSYDFTQPGNYLIVLNMENSYGCVGDLQKTLPLRSLLTLSDGIYSEDFEGITGWHSDFNSALGINSWKLGTSSKTEIVPYSGQNYWYTDITTNPAPREHSWIVSPCFSFIGTEKPTLVAQIRRSFSDNRDGANVQYSINDGISWAPLGTLNDGVNWYNSYFGSSGGQAEGWTAIEDEEWTETRHILDFLKGQQKVQFRISYNASGTSIGNDGMAVDDIRIVERNRTILIEHFTNSSDEECARADSMLNLLVQQSGSSIIDLQYHTEDPEDPFHTDNPIIPDTRQFYYGLTDVPYALINGGLKQNQRIDYVSLKPSESQIAVESLYDSFFKLEVTSMIQDTAILVHAVITPLIDLPLTELSVRMVILEPVIRDISGTGENSIFRNIVKAMLPDAAGYSLYKSWGKNEPFILADSWAFRNVYDSSQLRVVVFIQNENTKEIYQASLDTRGIVSGVNNPVLQDGDPDFKVYPNPVQNKVFIQFDPNLTGGVNVELFNNIGGLVYTGQVTPGTIIHELSMDAFPQGIYLLRLSTSKELLGTSKIVVAR